MPHSARQGGWHLRSPAPQDDRPDRYSCGPAHHQVMESARRLTSASNPSGPPHRGRMRVWNHIIGRKVNLTVALSLKHSESCHHRDGAWLLPGAHSDRTGSQDPPNPWDVAKPPLSPPFWTSLDN